MYAGKLAWEVESTNIEKAHGVDAGHAWSTKNGKPGGQRRQAHLSQIHQENNG